MAERTLVDRIAAEQEEVGPFSAQLLLAEVLEDLVRRVRGLERIVLDGDHVPDRATRGAAS